VVVSDENSNHECTFRLCKEIVERFFHSSGK
jgi:hypothetical protein